MRRIFLTVITLSQFFGALLALSYFDAALLQSPLGTLNTPQLLVTLATILIYLAGLIGSILIWVSKPAGLWLSFFHQLLIVPVFFIPGIFFWVMGDAISVAAVVGRDAINTSFSLLSSIGTNTLLQALNPAAGTSYYGINVFALICALYLNRLRKRKIFAAVGG